TYYDRVNLQQHADFPLDTIQLNPAPNARAKVAALRQHLAGRPIPPPLTSGYQPALHCALARTGRFHCLMHDTPSLFQGQHPTLKQRLRFAVSNWQIGRAMRRTGGVVIVTSEFLQAECRRDFGLHAEIARMGGLGQQHTFRPRPVTGHLNMLSVSRIEANKRIDWILDALAALEAAPTPLSQCVDWRLDLAGKGSQLEAMTVRARDLGLAGRVHFHGFVPDAALEGLYDDAHLFLMPAVQGYGIPAIEALGRGIPVLLHRESGVSDILLDTPWATVLTGGPEEMAPRLSGMLSWLLTNGHLAAPPPPKLPTEDTWA
ncbi:MAG TPA: glycosyltransferase, partial [Acidobacteriaceae bacterium]|nr:glycosyltransferase [Acidobacteriaceae bacterium]